MGLWSKLHAFTVLPIFFAWIIVSFIIYKFLNKKAANTKYVPLKIISIILIILEIIKQVRSLVIGYDLYYIPLHFCSLFLFLLPLHSFYKGKYKDKIQTLTLTTCACLMFVMLVFPTIVYGENNIKNYFKDFMSFHTVTFHLLVCLYFMIMIALKFYKFDFKNDLKFNTIFFSVYCFIAGIMAQLLKTNYHGMYKCNVEPVNELRLNLIDKYGYIMQILFVLTMSIGTLLIASLNYIIVNRLLNIKEKKSLNH